MWTLFDDGQLRGTGTTCLTLGGDLVTLSATTCASQPDRTRLTVSSAQRWSP